MRRSPSEPTITGTLQREAWLRRVMPPAEQLAGDLWSIPVPIPDNPLRYVSVYAFGTGEGLVLIDSGWDDEESWRSLLAGLESIGAGPAHVRGVLVTHMHFDHIGLAGRLRRASGAWVALHPADYAVLARPDYRTAELAVAREADFMCGLGASQEEAAAAVGTAEKWEKFTSVELPDRTLTDGELADIPNWKIRAVHTPGHTPGHLCFVDERSRQGSQRARRRHLCSSRAAARRAARRDTPQTRFHALGAGRTPDLVPALGPAQRPDADLRGHRDRRARAPARAAWPGNRQRSPDACLHGHPQGRY
jgi:glyoxylase-like metal-dependent hydrolase (beta-lactamase superfamily II)